jgi:polysaccharide biosynthesis transport protein
MLELAALVRLLRRRWRLMALIFVILLLAGTMAVLIMPRTYQATAMILVKRADGNLESSNYPQIDALLAWNRETTIETYVALATQPTIADAVRKDLRLRTSASDLLLHDVTVMPLTNSDIVQYIAQSRTREGSAALANCFAREFLRRQRELAASQAAEASQSVGLALDTAKQDLASDDRRLIEFESHYALANGDVQTTNMLAAISDTQSKLRMAELSRAQAVAEAARLSGLLRQTPATVSSQKTLGVSPTNDQLQSLLAAQQVRLRLLRRQFSNDYPDVVDARNQIDTLTSALRSTPGTRVDSLTFASNPVSAQLEEQLASFKTEAAGDGAQVEQLQRQQSLLYLSLRQTPSGVSELSNLQRQVKSDETIYDALQDNYFKAVVAKSMAVSDLAIVSWADPAMADVRPRLSVAILVIALVSLLISFASIWTIDWLRSH